MFRMIGILLLCLTSVVQAAEIDYSRPLSPPWRSSLVAESVANLPLTTGPGEFQSVNRPGERGVAHDGLALLKQWKIPLPEGPRAQQAADDIAVKLATSELTHAQVDAVCDAVTQNEASSIYAKLLAFRLQHLLGATQSDMVVEFSIGMSNPPGGAREQLALLALTRGYFDAAAAIGRADDTRHLLKLLAGTRVTDPLVKAAYLRELKRMKPLHEHAEVILKAYSFEVGAGEPKLTPGQRTVYALQQLFLGDHPDMDPDLILQCDSAELKALFAKSREAKVSDEAVAQLWFDAAKKRKDFFAAGLERTGIQYMRIRALNSKAPRSDPRVKLIRRLDPRYLQIQPPNGGELAIPLPTPASVVFVLDPSLRSDAGRWESVQAMVLDELDLLTEDQTTNVLSTDAKGVAVAVDLQKLQPAGDATEAAIAEWMKSLEASTRSSDAAMKAALKLKPDTIIFVTSATPAKDTDRQALITGATRGNAGGSTIIHAALVDSRSRDDAQAMLDLATLNGGIFWHLNTPKK